MILYTARRLAIAVLVFVCVTFLTFLLLSVRGPEVIAQSFLPPYATPEQVSALAERYGLTRPLLVQYVSWLGDLADGTFGRSFASGQPVSTDLAARIPVTLSLLLLSLGMTVVFALTLGYLAAVRGGPVDRVLQGLAVVVNAIPGYWIALIFAIVFGLTLRIVPATGYIPITVSVSGWFSSVIFPSLAIAIGPIAFVGIQVRGLVIDALSRDYVRTLRSRGLSSRRILFGHVLRNIAPPALTLLSLQVIGVVGGVVIVEQIFALPGLGTLILAAGTAGDLPVVLGTTAFMVLVIVGVNLATDLVNGILNPKARVA